VHVFYCSSFINRRTQRQHTFRYPKVSIISCTALCPVLSCATISLTSALRSSVMSAYTCIALHSVLAVLSRRLRSRSAMYLLAFFRFFSGRHTLWHPYSNIHRRDEVDQRYLQQNCSLRGIQSQHASKTIHHLQPYFRSGLWIRIGAHALDLYVSSCRKQIAIGRIAPSLVMKTKHT
jgi:hypothetical protein